MQSWNNVIDKKWFNGDINNPKKAWGLAQAFLFLM
jgi:hypothetical protein